jgi:hypothetical protein
MNLNWYSRRTCPPTIILKQLTFYRLSDTNVTGVSYTVTFDITITDVNDVAPVILNLPENVTLTRDEVKGNTYIYIYILLCSAYDIYFFKRTILCRTYICNSYAVLRKTVVAGTKFITYKYKYLIKYVLYVCGFMLICWYVIKTVRIGELWSFNCYS